MSRLFVDSDNGSPTEWAWHDQDEMVEYVLMYETTKEVGIINSGEDETIVYIADIPKVIKALHAVYDSASERDL